MTKSKGIRERQRREREAHPKPPAKYRRKEAAGRGIYIQLKRYNLENRAMEHVRGMGLRVYDWTAEEVHRIILRAFYEEQRRVKGST